MSITETTYRPTTASVEKKNSKYELSRALLQVFEAICELEESEKETKNYAYAVGRIHKTILMVL